MKSTFDLVAEARDQGTPYRSARVTVRVLVTDVNDNSPDIVDPQEDVVSVREEQPPGTEVVRIRAVDRDNGYNASITYSILKGRDSDGYGMFSIDPVSGLIRTRISLDHEERTIYRLAVAATDSGKPPKQTVRLLRIEVLDLNDNRPTFTSSSLVFRVSYDTFKGFLAYTSSESHPIHPLNPVLFEKILFSQFISRMHHLLMHLPSALQFTRFVFIHFFLIFRHFQSKMQQVSIPVQL